MERRLRRLRRPFAAITSALFLLFTWQGALACAHDGVASAVAVGGAPVSTEESTPSAPDVVHAGLTGEREAHRDRAESPCGTDGTDGTPSAPAPCHAHDAAPTCISMPSCAVSPSMPVSATTMVPVEPCGVEVLRRDLAPTALPRGPEPPPPRA